MIANPDWLKPKEKLYFHQTKLSSAHVSLECIEEIAAYIEDNDIEEMDCDTCFKMQVFCRNGGKYIIVHTYTHTTYS